MAAGPPIELVLKPLQPTLHRIAHATDHVYFHVLATPGKHKEIEITDCKTTTQVNAELGLLFPVYISSENSDSNLDTRDKKFEYGLVWDGAHRYC